MKIWKTSGLLHDFLGMEVYRQGRTLILRQQKYALDLLPRADMLDSRPLATPLTVEKGWLNSIKDLWNVSEDSKSVWFLRIREPHPTVSFHCPPRNEEVEITCRVGKTDACSRTEISSSGELELALTNKERMVTVASVGLLRPITPAPKVVAQRQNFSEAECFVIEAEDKESAKGKRCRNLPFHLGLVPQYSFQGEKRGNENAFWSSWFTVYLYLGLVNPSAYAYGLRNRVIG